MFTKILIANRGEIACRVIATAQRLGVRAVSVYSDADAGSRHVAMADEAVHIGPSQAAQSYLVSDKIIVAALSTGAQAIHPGYGFLSENPAFVEAVEAAGLIFIGPPASAIRAMGLKDAAKALMIKAGVPVVPGYHGEKQDPAFLAQQADDMGYPVMIKARAGGGGKGMRLVETQADFKAALEGAQREGQASFGDPACLVEKYISQPRHIEIQIFADGHGQAIHLFERDCSLQRRHQKVIEEAPAPDMPPAVRAAMGKAAVEAALAIGYQGAGTVEFIVDGSGPLREDGFWFMEMNTRLQVEHPVSEAITGLDFVELQLRVAAGEPLPMAQDELQINGWAFEARVYAEDVPKGFLPATGTLSYLAFPGATPPATEFEHGSIRIDSGVRQGDEISPWYDPMIAKIIVHGPTRSAALTLLTRALADCHIAGCTTNLAFLGALSQHTGFAAGQVDTGLIARDLEALTAQPPAPPDVQALAAIASLGLVEPRARTDPWDRLIGWRHWASASHAITLHADGAPQNVTVSILGDGKYSVQSPSGTTALQITNGSSTACTLTTEVTRFQAAFVTTDAGVTVFKDGHSYSFTRPDPLANINEETAGGDAVSAPMPGVVKLVSVAPKAQVKQGDALLVLEAMKMEHTLTAPRDGVVADILCREGDQVANGALVLTLEIDNDDECT